MKTLPKTEIAVPTLKEVAPVAKAELVFSKELDISNVDVNGMTIMGATLGGLLGFAFGGNSFDLLPLMGSLTLGFGGGVNVFMRYAEVQDSNFSNIGIKLKDAVIPRFRKEKRLGTFTFGINDPEGTCMKQWVNVNRSCEKGRETHVVTQYVVKRGSKFYGEQEVVQSLEVLWDSSLDAIEEYYSPHSYRW